MMLGNFTVEQMEERLGITLVDDDREFFKQSRQEKVANIANDKWHCFDIPFIIVCGSMKMAIKVRDILQPYEKQMKCKIDIGVDERTEKP